MLRLIMFLLFLILSVCAGIFFIQHPGYLLLAFQPWVVQMPLWLAFLLFIFFLALFYLLIISIDRIHFWWFRLKNWWHYRREHKLYSKTQHGLMLLIEGRWKKAENLLLKGVNQSLYPLMNYLGAAKAAQEQKAFIRRDAYLQKAYDVAPDAKLTIGLTQAELEFANDQLAKATATLNHLRQLSPRHPQVLKLLEKVYVRLSDWQNLQLLLPALRKAKVLNAEQAEQFAKNLYSEILRSSTHKNLNELQQIWLAMPRAMRKNPEVVTEYVQQLTRFPATNEMENLIRKTLKYNWQPALATMYGNLPFTNLNRQLVIVGAWQKTYGPQPELLLLLGKLCARLQLWGKAKDYFAKCLELNPNLEATLEYGKLLEHLGETDRALQVYQEELKRLATKKQGTQ